MWRPTTCFDCMWNPIYKIPINNIPEPDAAWAVSRAYKLKSGTYHLL